MGDIVDELNWKIAKENLPFFADQILGYTVMPFHREWLDDLTSYHRSCHVSSRDHGKSTMVSIAYPLWVITCNPIINSYDKPNNNDIMLISNSLDQSTALIEKIKIKIEENEALQSVNWAQTNKSEVRVKEKGNHNTIISKAFGSSGVRGNHPRICIVDDGLSETSYTNEYTHDFFFNSISGMLKADSYLHVVGTRFSFNDLYATLAEPERGYHYREYPALDENGVPLWAERYSYEDLMQKKREVGNLSFAREYMCVPLDSSSSIFPVEVVEKCKRPEESFEFVGDGKSRYICAYDLAVGGKATSDYFVATTLKNDFTGKIKLVDLFYANKLDYEEQIAVVEQLQMRYKPAQHVVENNGFQKIVEQMLSKRLFNVKGRTTGRQNKENSIYLIRSMLESNTLILPYGDARTRDAIDRLIYELAAFGIKNGKLLGVGTHDDTVSSLSMAVEAMSEFKGIGGDCAVAEVKHPLGISGELDIDLSLPWMNQTAFDLGIEHNYNLGDYKYT